MSIISRLKSMVVNPFRQAMWGLFMPGTDIFGDYSLKQNIKDGYEKNPTVFGMINKLSRMAANVRLIPMIGEKESETDPLKEAFKSHDGDYTYKEFLRHWFSFAYALGEPIVYWPTFQGGNDKGKLMGHPDIMPPQNLIIESGGFKEMVRYYRMDTNRKIPLDKENVWHTRIFLNLDFTDGKNYRALAPLSVAADIIRSLNETNKTIYQTLKKGFPPGILANRSLKNLDEAKESQSFIEKEWESKFGGSENRGRPIIGSGDIAWLPIGFSNFRDLQLIENSSHGRSILCNLWGVPEELFSSERSTLDNKNTARKLAYEDSIIPIVEDYVEGLNKRTEPAYGITYKIDLTSIPAMQEDKYKIAQTMEIGRRVKAVTKDEFRVAQGLEPVNTPEFGLEGLTEEGDMPEINYQQGTRL